MLYRALSAVAVVAAGLAPFSADAAKYTIPAGPWAQLQSVDTYASVCTSSDPQPCDVEPGVYTLITFVPGGETRERVMVSPDTSFVPGGSSAGPEIIYQPAVIEDMYTGGSVEGFSVPCPADTSIIGGSCALSADYTVGGRAEPLSTETRLDAVGNALVCTVLGDVVGDRGPGFGTATAVCVANASRALPTMTIRP